MSEAKPKGLLLDLPGASNERYTVAGVPGEFSVDDPVPVGDDEAISLDRAKELDKEKGVPLRLVDLKNADKKGA